MVMFPALGSTHVPLMMEVVCVATHLSASPLVRNPVFVRLLPSGVRYWTRHFAPLAVSYRLIDAIVFVLALLQASRCFYLIIVVLVSTLFCHAESPHRAGRGLG